MLYCNARSSLGFRVQALSSDGGIVFQPGQLVEKLVETPNGCHGSVIGFPQIKWEDVCKDTCYVSMELPKKLKLQYKTYHRTGQKFQTPTWVLYSHPTSTHSRINLGVYLSPYPKDADSWRGPWVIYEGPSAYSDLAYIELPSTFACLYENGLKSPYEQISFSIFTLCEVIQNLPLKPNVLHIPVDKDKKKGKCKTS
ncbi:unnamed protein product [Staurois parvus]|uniref:Exo-alpha-sialidase n=1 Tax=Staurois parvus TaxID=386267 RepID=A0ABN9AJN6_9NEOB|nr:unnamed protein product [Staurois parvus]